MNLTAAWVTGATVTVYFVGLVHFRNVGTTADVIVPLANSTTTKQLGTTLARHGADVTVINAALTAANCPSPGVYTTTGPSPACTITGLSNQVIQLPTSSSANRVTTTNFDIPHLTATTFCPNPNIGNLSGIANAATLTIAEGMLSACTDGHAWVSHLTISDASDTVTVGTTTVTLPTTTDSIIVIGNNPILPVPDDPRTHFWWHFKLYTNTSNCTGLPCAPPTVACPDSYPKIHPYATGVGCSNTQYP